MKLFNAYHRGFIVLALLVCAALAAAQGGGGRQGRGGRNNNSELGLANRKDVQRELAVTDDQATKIADLAEKMRGQGRQRGAGGGGGTPPDPAAMRAQMIARQKEQHDALAGILNEGQMKRLGEISIQLRGNRALLDESVQKALGLSTDQVSKIEELNTKMQDANREVGQKIRDGSLSREDAQAARENNNKIMDGELAKILSADQAAKLKDLGGKPFTPDAPGGI